MRKRHGELEDRERGAGSVQSIGYFFALAILFFTLVIAGAMMQAKHRAQTGADLGAIAGAQAISRGENPTSACAYASGIVNENKGELFACDVAGQSVTLYVQSRPALPSLPRVHAKAVAAPEDY